MSSTNTQAAENPAAGADAASEVISPEIKKQAAPGFAGFNALTDYQKELQKRTPKVQIILLILVLQLIGTGLINDAYIPAIVTVADYFKVAVEYMQAIVPYYLIGSGIGQIICGPFIDRFGRKSIIVIATVLGVLSNLWLINTNDYHTLVLIRVLQGVIFSSFGIVPSVILKDIYSPKQFIVYNSWLITLFLFAPAIAPLIGGYIFVHFGWQMIFNFISGFMIFSLLVFYLAIPETLDPAKRQPFNTVRIIKNYGSILHNLKSVNLIAIGSIYGVAMFSGPTLLPATFLQDFHVNPQYVGYLIFVMVIFIITGIQLNQFFLRRGFNPARIWLTASTLQVLSTLVNIVLICTGSINLWTLILTVSMNVFFNGFQIGNQMSIYLMPYGHMTGTANSLIAAFRLIVPGVIVTYISHLSRHGGATVLATYAVVFVITCALSWLYYLQHRELFAKGASRK